MLDIILDFFHKIIERFINAEKRREKIDFDGAKDYEETRTVEDSIFNRQAAEDLPRPPNNSIENDSSVTGASIYDREVFILIDKSGSMVRKDYDTRGLSRWDYLQEQIESLVFRLTTPIKGVKENKVCDKVQVHFFSRNEVESGHTIKDASNVQSLFLENVPFGNTFVGPTLNKCLDTWISNGQKEGRGAFFFIYTDGLFDDEGEFVDCLVRAGSVITNHRLVKFFVLGLGQDIDIDKFVELDSNIDQIMPIDVFVFDMVNKVEDIIELLERQVLPDEPESYIAGWFQQDKPKLYKEFTGNP